jgi:hypothetical protein
LTYQPAWINGRTCGASRRDCVTRYEAIAGECAHLAAGFTVVDVGAQRGYFSVRMADQLGATVTAVDGDALRDGLWEMPHERVTGVYRNLEPGDLEKLGPFDVGLCLSVLHHVPWWPQMVEELMDACSLVFFEVAVPGENLAWISERTEGTSRMVRELPGAREICRVPGFDTRFMRPTYVVPGRNTSGD